MTGAEEGLLLLCSTLGDPESRPLSCAQFRELSRRAAALGLGDADPQRELTERDLRHLGYAAEQAQRTARLLARVPRLQAYLAAAECRGIAALTRITPGYPAALRALLGDRAPMVLWYRGALELLREPCVSVVGSRQPEKLAIQFACRVGALAAEEGFALCTGGADGVDTEAKNACLAGGGRAILFPAGRLTDCKPDSRILYLAETDYDAPFSAPRALARNRLIHALGERTYAAQPRLRSGGTWRGCADHLRWIAARPLYLLDDGSDAAASLAAQGAILTGIPETLRSETARGAGRPMEPEQLCLYAPEDERINHG